MKFDAEYSYSTHDVRCVKIAEYLIRNKSTVRDTAKFFGISKSTVHKDVTEKLRDVNLTLYTQASAVLATNKAERHLRGGNATKAKYDRIRTEGNVDKSHVL